VRRSRFRVFCIKIDETLRIVGPDTYRSKYLIERDFSGRLGARPTPPGSHAQFA
jgi:hypothetical protein